MRRIYNKAYILKLFKRLKNRPLRIKPGHLYTFMANSKLTRPGYAIWTRNGMICFGQFNYDGRTITEIARTPYSSQDIKVGCSPLNFFGTTWYGKDYYSVHDFEDVSIDDLDIEMIWYYVGLSDPHYLGNYCVLGDGKFAPIDYMN